MCNRSRGAEVELTRFDHIQVHFVSKTFVFRFDAARGAEATFCFVFYIFNHSSIPVLRATLVYQIQITFQSDKT